MLPVNVNFKTKIYKIYNFSLKLKYTKYLLPVLYWRRDEESLSVFRERVLRRIFGPTREKGTNNSQRLNKTTRMLLLMLLSFLHSVWSEEINSLERRRKLIKTLNQPPILPPLQKSDVVSFDSSCLCLSVCLHYPPVNKTCFTTT